MQVTRSHQAMLYKSVLFNGFVLYFPQMPVYCTPQNNKWEIDGGLYDELLKDKFSNEDKVIYNVISNSDLLKKYDTSDIISASQRYFSDIEDKIVVQKFSAKSN